MRRLARAVLACLLAAVVLPSAARAGCLSFSGPRCPFGAPQVIGGGDDGVLHTPVDAALSPDGHLYVVDETGTITDGHVDEYDRTGRFVGELRPPQSASFDPAAVAVTRSGEVAVLDYYGSTLWRFDAGGTLLGQTTVGPGAPSPAARQVAAAPDGTIWLLYDDGRAEHRGADGSLLGSVDLGPQGIAQGFGVGPSGDLFSTAQNAIAEHAPDGRLVRTLPEAANGRIGFAADGDVLSTFASAVARVGADGSDPRSVDRSGSAPGQFDQLQGVLVAPPGLLAAAPDQEALVVVDRDNHRLQVLGADDAPLQVIGAPGDGALSIPMAAWTTTDGGVDVADRGYQRIVRFGLDGTYLGRADGGTPSFTTVGTADPVTGGSDVVSGPGHVRRLAPDGHELASWDLPLTDSSGATSIAAAADGTLDVAIDDGPFGVGRVLEYAPDGTLRGAVGTAAGPGQVSDPRSVAAGPGGELYVGNQAGTSLDVFGPDGAFRRALGDRFCVNSDSLAVDALGHVYTASGSVVRVLDASGLQLASYEDDSPSGRSVSIDTVSVTGTVLTLAEGFSGRVVRLPIDESAFGPGRDTGCRSNGALGLATATSRQLTLRGTVARLPLACAPSKAAAPCGGTAVLSRKIARRGRKTTTHVVASAPYTLLSGRAATLALRVHAADRRLLRARRRLHVALTLAPTGGTARVRSATLKLPPRAAGHR